ncbi:hypothetical protein Cgig2_007311 [Carnegiea gigantea]|uniref:SCP domain-containing protein n=1 Tax=Carnegiea gigantea TaxID=171969 RepID=A0A9Q1QQR4_9CARY|nr:hypothetical protein Cgig2_007311 [Carnegiea gigantea]
MPRARLLGVSVIVLSLLSFAHGLAPPRTRSIALPDPAQEFLSAHNEARAEVGVGPLRWSPSLANATARLATDQRVKSACRFADLSSDKIKYGANQLWAQGAVVRPAEAVAAWVAEKKYYNYANDSCAVNHQCGVYKQVVWRKSVEVGCAQARCAKDGSSLTVDLWFDCCNQLWIEEGWGWRSMRRVKV